MADTTELQEIVFLVRIYQNDGLSHAVSPGIEDRNGRLDASAPSGALAAIFRISGSFLPWISGEKKPLEEVKGSILALRGRAFVVTELDLQSSTLGS